MKIYHFKKGKSHYTNQKDDTYGIWFLCGAKADQGETIIGLGDGLICKTCQKIINGDTIEEKD